MSITIKKINDIQVTKPEAKQVQDTRVPKCHELFPDCYSNVFILARKKSGKSVLIFNMIKKIVSPNTHVLIFCSTFQKDPIWLEIQRWLKKHNITFTPFLGITEGKIDHLQQFMSLLEHESLEQNISESEEEESEDKDKKYFSDEEEEHVSDFESDLEEKDPYFEEDESRKERNGVPTSRIRFSKKESSVKTKEKYLTPEYLLIFDDISNELKNPNLVAWYKRSRHYKALTISSTQYINDLKPEQIRQQDVIIAFKGLDQQKLKKLYIDADLSNITFEQFCDMYHNATDHDKFSFFYIGVRTDQFRKNFDKQYFVTH
jgi:hypothetical protein